MKVEWNDKVRKEEKTDMLIRPQDIGRRYRTGCARIVLHSVNEPENSGWSRGDKARMMLKARQKGEAF